MAAKCDWIVLIPDHEGALPKRLAARPAHLEGLAPRVQSGTWTLGGATVSEPPVEGQPKKFNGSCIVAHAASKEEVLAEIKKDIYATEGVWDLDKIIIRPSSKLGTKIFIHDVDQNAVNKLCAKHPGTLISCSSPKDLAEKSNIIFTMLPEGRHAKVVYLDGPGSIISANLTHKMLLDCSTIDPATSLAIGSAIQQRHSTASFYDAPVSGGVLGAENATLGIFLGCDEADPNFAQLYKLLSVLGSNIIPCGGPSLGLVAKLANNYLSGTIAIATSEAMILGMKAGMNPKVLARFISAGSGQNHIADKFNPVPGICPEAPSSRGYRGGFKVELMRKDMTLALDIAADVGVQLALGTPALTTYIKASEDPRCRGLDSRVVFRHLGGDEDWQRSLQEEPGH